MKNNNTSLLKQREEYLREQEEASQERIIREREEMVEFISEFFNDDKLDEILIDELIKNGLIYVNVGRCLCGKNGCQDGDTIFNILDEKKVFDKYKEQGINVRFRSMDCFEFTLGEKGNRAYEIFRYKDDTEYRVKVRY